MFSVSSIEVAISILISSNQMLFPPPFRKWNLNFTLLKLLSADKLIVSVAHWVLVGIKLASGIYLIEMIADGNRKIEKLVVN